MPERSVAEAVPRRRRSRAASSTGPAPRHADARVLSGARNSPPAVLALQRRIGNRAVLRALDAETAGPAAAPVAPVRARSLSELLADPQIGPRLEAIARRGGDVRAQIVEEVASEQIRVDVAQSGTHPAGPVEFIEGYRIRDINGRQLTDGLVLAGTGGHREALKVLEVKSSTAGAEALHSREERRESKSAVAERERDIVKGGYQEGEHLTAESGGQMALDRERLHEFPVRIYSKDMKTSQVVRVVPTRRTVYTGGVPRGESLEAVSKAFEEHPLGIRFAPMEVAVTQAELDRAEELIARRAGVEPRPLRQARPQTSYEVEASGATRTVERDWSSPATMRKQTKSVKVEFGELAATIKEENKRAEKGPEAGPASTSSEATRIGLGGVSQTSARQTEQGGRRVSTSSTSAVTRGGGMLGVETARTGGYHKVEEGEAVSGVETTRRAGGGLVASPKEGFGLGGHVGMERTRTHAKGVTTGVTARAEGRATINVEQLEDDPTRYRIVLRIHAGGKLGASGGAERGTGLKGGASASAGASLAGTLVFGHVMSREDTEAYLRDVDLAAGGKPWEGRHPEMGILAAGFRSGWEAGGAAVDAAKAALLQDVDAFRALPDGASIELTLAAGAEGKLGGTAGAAGGPGVELGIGGSLGRTSRFKVAKQGGKVVITREVKDESSWTASGGVSYGVGRLAEARGRAQSEMRSVTFTLDPSEDNKDFAEQVEEIRWADSAAAVARIAAKYPGVTSQAWATTSGKTTDTTLGAAFVAFTLSGASAYEEEGSVGPEGRKLKVSGSSTLGSSVSLFGLPKVGGSTEEKLTGTVAGGEVTADVSRTSRSTDLGASLSRLGTLATRNPLGLLTGGAEVMQETVSVAGIRMTPADLDAIMASARSDSEWMHAVQRFQLLDEWRATAAEINANPSHENVVRALARFAAGDGYDRGGTIERLLRPIGAGATTGVRYQIPAALSGLKGTFDEAVMGDPLGEARKLVDAGQLREALLEVQKQQQRVDEFIAELEAKGNLVRDIAARGDMLRRAYWRRVELRRAAYQLGAHVPGAAAAPTGPGGVRAEAEAQLKDGIALLRQYKASEEGTFAAIRATWQHSAFFGLSKWERRPVSLDLAANDVRLNRLLEVYAQWMPLLERLRELARAHGLAATELDGLVPDRARYDRARAWQKP